MSHPYWTPSPQVPTWPPPYPNSDVMLESQLEQIRSLGRIEANQEMQGQRIDRLEVKFDKHVEDCQRPRRWWRDLTKENWSWLLAAAVLALNLLGQPQAAEKLSSASPRQEWWDSSR